MLKTEFLMRLRRGIDALPQHEIEECVTFYREMIDDRMEEGLMEADAVLAVGSVDEIVSQMLSGTPMVKREKVKRAHTKRRLRTGEIVLLAVGSPIWLSLLIAAFAVVFALYVSLWAVLVSLWAAFASLIGGAVGMLAMGVLYVVLGNGTVGLASLGAGLVCAGLAIFAFFGCRAATRGTVWVTKKPFVCMKARWGKKEVEQ